jgi:DNA polymerase-1
MIEHALLDGDILAYRCATVNENNDESIACWQVSEMLERMLHETNAMRYTCYLTGSGNFRYDVYPEYKANRKDVPKPRHLSAVREHLVTEWKAQVTDGIEADDALGIEQCLSNDNSTVIVSIDKDLLMVPGNHYSFEISGTGSTGAKWVRPAEWRVVSPLMGLRHFYSQVILGDRSDNVLGFDGKMRAKVPLFLKHHFAVLDECTTEPEMYAYVRGMYELGDDVMHQMAKVLWIMRKDNDYWQPPVNTILETGHPDDFIRL